MSRVYIFVDGVPIEWEATEGNLDRVQRAADTLRHYAELDGSDKDAALVDLLVDLRHHCAKEGMTLEDALRMSQEHFDAERNGEEG